MTLVPKAENDDALGWVRVTAFIGAAGEGVATEVALVSGSTSVLVACEGAGLGSCGRASGSLVDEGIGVAAKEDITEGLVGGGDFVKPGIAIPPFGDPEPAAGPPEPRATCARGDTVLLYGLGS